MNSGNIERNFRAKHLGEVGFDLVREVSGYEQEIDKRAAVRHRLFEVAFDDAGLSRDSLVKLCMTEPKLKRIGEKRVKTLLSLYVVGTLDMAEGANKIEDVFRKHSTHGKIFAQILDGKENK